MRENSTRTLILINFSEGAKLGKETTQGSGRSALLQSIATGKKLKKVVGVKEVSILIISLS